MRDPAGASDVRDLVFVVGGAGVVGGQDRHRNGEVTTLSEATASAGGVADAAGADNGDQANCKGEKKGKP